MGKAEYARIPSSTDDEEKSLGYTTQTSPAHFYVRFSRSPFLYLLDFALALVVIFLLIWRNVDAKVQRLELQDDITGYAPKFSHRLVTFKSEPQFISNHSSLESLAEAREYWKTLVPPGQGFIELNDERATNFDIPKKINFMVNGVERHFLGTSIVHSVHCLYSIMAEYDAVVLGIRKQPIDTWHMDHCFDYLRQAIMCGGDTALAGEDFPGGSSQFEVVHVCKNWDEIYDWLDDTRVGNVWQFGEEELGWVPPD